MTCEKNILIFSKSWFGVLKKSLFLHLWIKHLHHEVKNHIYIYLESICIMSIYIMKFENSHLHLNKGHLHWNRIWIDIVFRVKKMCLHKEKICIWAFSFTFFFGHENCIALGKVKDICIDIHDSWHHIWFCI